MSNKFNKPWLSPDDRKFLRTVDQGLAKGKTQAKIAEELNIANSTLLQKMARLGYQIEKRVVPIGRSQEINAA